MTESSHEYLKYAVAILLGAVWHYGLLLVWSYLPEHNPISNYLFACCVRQNWFLPLLYLHDVIIHCLLAMIPAAFIVALRANRLWLCVALAVVPALIYTHIPINWLNWTTISGFAFLFNLAVLSAPIPLATMLLRRRWPPVATTT